MKSTRHELTLDEWLRESPGRAAAMARDFDVTEAAVSHWRLKVPRARILEVHRYTRGAVSLAKMLADAQTAEA